MRTFNENPCIKEELLYQENINELNLNVFSQDINLPVVCVTKTFYFTNGNIAVLFIVPLISYKCLSVQDRSYSLGQDALSLPLML